MDGLVPTNETVWEWPTEKRIGVFLLKEVLFLGSLLYVACGHYVKSHQEQTSTASYG